MVQVPSLRDERQTVADVLKVGHRLGLQGWVLYPTRDETVAAFSRSRSLLTEYFRVPTPEWSTVRWAWDKRNVYELAIRLDIPTPRTWWPRDLGELDQIDVDLPLAIKPAVKARFVYATRAKAWRANNRAELAERFQKAAALVQPGEVMVQELIPGDGHHQFACCVFFKSGRSVASMVAQRRRQHPPEFGKASTYVETVESPVIEALSERFLRAIDYYGLAELEYKLDPRDGKHKLLDVNARTWGYHMLGGQAGVDFPYLLYADQLGQPVEPSRARTGVRWIRMVTDLPTAARALVSGELGWREYFRTLRGTDGDAVFSREDPWPGLAELLLIPYLYAKRGF
jgi:predicted ATP-grasp superfamily ATP-dependent carboligase